MGRGKVSSRRKKKVQIMRPPFPPSLDGERRGKAAEKKGFGRTMVSRTGEVGQKKRGKVAWRGEERKGGGREGRGKEVNRGERSIRRSSSSHSRYERGRSTYR